MIKPPMIIRPAKAEDAPFIFNSWLESYKSSGFARSQKKQVYFDNYKPIVQRIVASAQAIVACNPEDPDQIFGYIVYEPGNLVHYCYVKNCYRKLGIAGRLVQEVVDDSVEITASHSSDALEEIKKKQRQDPKSIANRISFNPYIILISRERAA